MSLPEPYLDDPDVTLYAGECVQTMRELAEAGVRVDAVVCDPPYGLAMIGEAWDRPRALVSGTTSWAEAAYALAAPGAHLVCSGAAQRWHEQVPAVEAAGWKLRQVIAGVYWDGRAPTATSLRSCWEPWGVFTRQGEALSLAVEAGRIPWYDPAIPLAAGREETGASGASWANCVSSRHYKSNVARSYEAHADGRWPATVYCHSRPRGLVERLERHPYQKSLALMRWLIRLVARPGSLVLDPFAGSGTTLLAARQEGARAIGIERESDYCQVAARRLRQLSLLESA